MITLQNYIEKTKGIDFSKQPEALKKGHDFMLQYSDMYGEDSDIDKAIDNHLEKINQLDFFKQHVIVAKMPKAEEKKVDLGFGMMGSGTTVWDRNRKEAGSYKNVAHINEFGKINYYDKNLPQYAIKEIEAMAKGSLDPVKDEGPNSKKYSDPRISFDRDSDSFWVDNKEGKGQKSFETRKEAYEYLNGPAKEKEFTCEVFDAEGKRDISPAAITKLEACTEKQPQTKEAHFKNGAYTPERLQLHQEILSRAKEKKPCIIQRQPVAVLTGGPPGSGKSTWLKKYAKWISSDNVYHIDADEVRAKLPEYKGWNATATQQETKDIVNNFIDEIGKPCEYDLVYDGTMNKATSYQPLIDKLKGLGYKIFIIYISVPKEVSQKRVLERYRKRGRYVPKVVIDEVYERGLDAFDKLTKEADGFIRVDGETGKIIDKGGMPIPKKERYAKPAKGDHHDCGCKDKKHEEKCDDCKEHEKSHRETAAEKEKRVKNAEQFIHDVEHNPELRKMTEGQIIAIGLQFEKDYRTGTAQKRDEKHDGKKRLSPSPENLVRWMKNPGHFDLIGVDTFERIDPTANYKKEISKQKFWNRVFGIKV